MQTALEMANEIIKTDKELRDLKLLIKKMDRCIKLAEEWCEDQTLSREVIAYGCIRDVRRFIQQAGKL
jgi:hypothetical protein